MNNKREMFLYSIFIVLFIALIGMTIYWDINRLISYTIPLVLAFTSIDLILSLGAIGLIIYASIKKFKDKEYNVNTFIMILMLILLKNPISENVLILAEQTAAYNYMLLAIIIISGISIIISLLGVTLFKKNKVVNLILSSLGVVLITTSLILEMSGMGMGYLIFSSILEIMVGLVAFTYVLTTSLNRLKNN